MALTPQAVLRQEILQILTDMPDGQGSRQAVLLELGRRRSSQWTAEDLQSPSRRPHESNWENRASYERADMVRAELLVASAGRGIWRLTPNGRAAASGNMFAIDPQGAAWDLAPGEELSREDRAALYGGSIYGGIQPSTSTPNLFLYSDSATGRAYGYTYDGWDSITDIFLYTGEGASGDQRLRVGNKAIADHVDSGLAIRLFIADGVLPNSAAKRQIYLGEFQVDSDIPWIRAEAPDREGVLRSVLVFRLRPTGVFLRRPQDISQTGDAQSTAQHAREELSFTANGELKALEATRSTEYVSERAALLLSSRREAQLVERFSDYLVGQGREVNRFLIRPEGTLRPIVTDVHDATSGVLYEVKAAATRENVRMAIGQLMDYGRYTPSETRFSVLLPSFPADDLIGLLRLVGLGLVVEESTGRFHVVLDPAGGVKLG